jgi:membrane protein
MDLTQLIAMGEGMAMTEQDRTEQSRVKDVTAPSPDDPRKPDDPGDLSRPARKFILKNTLREFMDDECTDIAAGLTYYAVLSLFPGILALVSVLGLVGQTEQTTSTMLGMLRELGAGSVLGSIRQVIVQLTQSQSAGLTLVIGLLLALWSASGYVNSFGRALNRIYEIDEGRPIWKLRPMMLLVTAILLVMAAGTTLALVVSGPVAETIGSAVGLSDLAVTVWSIAKWPVLLVVVIVMVALLYHFTPNVRQPNFRWLSIGAVVAILTWVLASVAFGFYVANFGSYNKTYGSLGGVIVFLLWLWITNLALLFGAELDAETERGRELQAGIEAEETIQLPPRDTTKSEKDAKKAAKQVAEARELRERSGGQTG